MANGISVIARSLIQLLASTETIGQYHTIPSLEAKTGYSAKQIKQGLELLIKNGHAEMSTDPFNPGQYRFRSTAEGISAGKEGYYKKPGKTWPILVEVIAGIFEGLAGFIG